MIIVVLIAEIDVISIFSLNKQKKNIFAITGVLIFKVISDKLAQI